MPDVPQMLAAFAERLEPALVAVLSGCGSGAAAPPERLLAAMRYGTLAGGKRLRPFLLVQTAAIFGVAEAAVQTAALALEMVHCYSLIHDDLPAMDDDDLRRGRPTVHRAFDDATAILAGDALLTEAFALLCAPSAHLEPAVRVELIAELAAGAGSSGMVGGQMRDLEGERVALDSAAISLMQGQKTGALIRAAVRMGALLGNADPAGLAALTSFGEAAGRAFQLGDDLLDVTASSDAMGKATGKDGARNKQTLVARLGVAEARRHLDATVDEAVAALSDFGTEADRLRQTALYLGRRRA